MSGKCFLCASQFGFFKKEHGCPSCGFAFCKECLKNKIAVPKRNHEVHKVCNKCYNVLSGTVDRTAAKHSPPEALKKRLAALENRQKHSLSPTGVGGAKPVAATSHNYKGMSQEDIALHNRLDNLRKERQKDLPPTPSDKEIEARLKNLKDQARAPPSDEEMARRLAVLKGQDPKAINQPPIILKPTVRKTEQQQIDELLDEICDEVKIDSQEGNSGMTNVTLSKDNKTAENKSGEEVNLGDVTRVMHEVATELELDAQRAIQGLQQDKELMERLNQLKNERKNTEQRGEKDTTKSSNSESSDEDSENEEQAMKRIIKQAFEENKLDQDLEESGVKAVPSSSSQTKGAKTKRTQPPPPENEDSDPDEFPWCCICNEDATLRCLGCDYDLYCNRCFKEGHEQLDMPDHRTVPFKQGTN